MSPPIPGPAHTGGGVDSIALLLVLLLAGLGASAVGGLALAAVLRRRSRSYVLIALAVFALGARTAVAFLSIQGTIGAGTHHLFEHGLDVVMVALVIAAVYLARQRSDE